MIIRGWMIILSEYPNYGKYVLYYLRASLPRSIITNTWSYVPYIKRIRVQVQQYSEIKGK